MAQRHRPGGIDANHVHSADQEPTMCRPRSYLAAAGTVVLVLWSTAHPRPATAAPMVEVYGTGSAEIQIVNLDDASSATVFVDFYQHFFHRFSPRQPVGYARRVAPGTFVNMGLPTEGELPHALYGARQQSDHAIGGWVRTDWSTVGATMAYSAVAPATEVVVPLFLKRAEGQDGAIAVMIDGDDGGDVELTLWAADGSLALRQTYAFEPHEPRILPLAAASPSGLPFPGIGFIGWASLRSQVPLAAVGLVDSAASQFGAYAFEGVPIDRTGKTLHAPFVRRSSPRGPGDTVTTLWLTNPNDRATTVSLRYDGNAGTCAGQTFVDGPHVVAAHAMVRFDPRTTGALPMNCVATAMVIADANVAAVAVDTIDGGNLRAAYTASAATDGATRIALPMVRRQHTAKRFTTAIAVQNTSATLANIEIAFRDANGIALAACGAACRVVLSPGAGHFFYPSTALNGIPVGSQGSATLTSDQPIVAIVNDVSEVGSYDASIYSGIQWPVSAPAEPLLAPFVLNHAVVDFAPTLVRRYFPWSGTGPRVTAGSPAAVRADGD